MTTQGGSALAGVHTAFLARMLDKSVEALTEHDVEHAAQLFEFDPPLPGRNVARCRRGHPLTFMGAGRLPCPRCGDEDEETSEDRRERLGDVRPLLRSVTPERG